MSENQKLNIYKNRVEELEAELSKMKLELEDVRFRLDDEREKHLYYRLIADFTYDWELWFKQSGEIKYCSPSCYDLTGFSSNQIINSSGIVELLVYEDDKQRYRDFFTAALNQALLNQSLEFRILTLTKQLRWCMMSVRAVYDKQGKYLGIRASVKDITRLKKAMGHIQTLEKGKEFEFRTKQRLQSELELKDRELVSFLLQLSQKNELLAKLHFLAERGKAVDSKRMQSLFVQLTDLLKSESLNRIDWSMVEGQIEKSHPGFLSRLQTKHPTISEKDKKLCAYIRLGLSSKEIAGLLNITFKSVEIARVRLRKKMELPQKLRLQKYISFL